MSAQKDQPLYFAFDTTSKPGKVLCFGISYHVLEIDGSMENVSVPLLAPPNATVGFIRQIKNLLSALNSNF